MIPLLAEIDLLAYKDFTDTSVPGGNKYHPTIQIQCPLWPILYTKARPAHGPEKKYEYDRECVFPQTLM